MSAYLEADRICDLVMKGGITSGVVYPPAIDRISKRFWLSGIGGTSAGAIAAALAGAAELSRRNGDVQGYLALEGLPQEINGNGRLLSLFKPDRSTKGAFRLATRAMELNTSGAGFVLPRLAARYIGMRLTQNPLKRVAANGLGLCSGMANDNRSPNDPIPPLTEWLSGRINQIAGLDKEGDPLTFGDLWAAPAPPDPKLAAVMGETVGIQLQLVTTCLTFGRPYALPYLDNRFAFSPEEFKKLFPDHVVEYLEREGRAILVRLQHPPADGLLPLPVGDKLPVIVGVRMSLSFPGLFSVVPLHYLNGGQDKTYDPVFFADGGITSNMPSYFFDSPFPRWPTLAINLQYAQKPGEYGREGVDSDHTWMTRDNSDGLDELFNRFRSGQKPGAEMLAYLGAIFRSAQVWSDNSFLKLPGFRDRFAEIWLDAHEGGMNLDMPPKVIMDQTRYGDNAGRRLVERFAEAPGTEAMSWDGHRWARYRAGMAALVFYLRRWDVGVSNPMPGDRELSELLASVDAPPSYKFRTSGGLNAEKRRGAAEQATAELREFIKYLDAFEQADDGHQHQFRPFDRGPRSSLKLQARSSLTPHSGPELRDQDDE